MTTLKMPPLVTTPTVFAETVTITPALAESWLTRNVRNRKLKPGSINAYARDMTAGRWLLSGQPIIFDSNGALADGQNRLHAVIKAGVPVEMMVVSGVAPEAQAVMDSGVKRSVSDSLTLEGVPNSAALTAAARFALSDPEAGFGSAGVSKANVTVGEIRDWIEEQGANIHAAAAVATHYYPSIDISPSVLCIAWLRLAAIDQEQAGEFFSSIADCRTNGAGDPRAALIKRLGHVRRDRERVSQRDYLSLMFRAWNAWRAGQSIKSFPMTSGTGVRVRVPTPK